MKVKITDKYIVIRVADVELFEEDSLYTVVVDASRGVEEVMGKDRKSGETKVQSYLFDKNKWTIESAREWVKSKEALIVEKLNAGRLYVASSMKLCSSLPKISAEQEPLELTRDSFQKAALNSRYYFYVEGVHEGFNGNDHYFYADELTKSYKTAAYQLIDWEHISEQVIGSSQESELLTHPDRPMALAYNGILNRLSPWMQVLDIGPSGKEMSRDEIIRERWFEGKLATSMECYFDKIRCTECQQEFTDWLDFEIHKYTSHLIFIESGGRVGMGLIGIDFVGWGIVAYPADADAYAISLRTGDDGTIKDIQEAALKEKYGSLAFNKAFAIAAAKAEPHDSVIFEENSKKFAFASEKYTQTVKKDDNKNNIDNKSGGNPIMFELMKKVAGAKSLSELFVIAQKTLKDYMGDKPLEVDAQKAFAVELSECVTSFVSSESFKVSDIYTLTDKAKMEAVQAAREEEVKTANEKLAALQAKLDSAMAEIESLKATVSEKDAKISELETAEAEKELANKVEAALKDIKDSGITLSGTFETHTKEMLFASLRKGEEGKVEVENFKKDLVASYKQSVLEEGSRRNGGITPGGDNEPTGLAAKLKAKREELENKNK